MAIAKYIVCSLCKQKLPVTRFPKASKTKRGHRSECRRCNRTRSQTPKYLATVRWSSLQQRLRKNPAYSAVELRVSRQDFMAWIIPLLELWDWTQGTPTVDRNNVLGHYELSNMQVIPMGVNAGKDKKNNLAPLGTKWCGDCNDYRPFSEFTLDRSGTFGLAGYCKDHKRSRWHRSAAARRTVIIRRTRFRQCPHCRQGFKITQQRKIFCSHACHTAARI